MTTLFGGFLAVFSISIIVVVRSRVIGEGDSSISLMVRTSIIGSIVTLPVVGVPSEFFGAIAAAAFWSFVLIGSITFGYSRLR